MMRRGRRDPASVERARLITAAIALIAARGVGGVTVTAIGEAASLDARAVSTHFGGLSGLLTSVGAILAADPVLPEPGTITEPQDSGELLAALAAAYRAYVAQDPVRFAALLQLAGAALFGRAELMGLMRARDRRTRAAAAGHLMLFREAGLVSPQIDVSRVAEVFVHGLHGIEMCHSLDQREQVRDAAYRELCAITAERVRP